MIRPHSTTLDIVIIGLTITSSWGNGHATTYRGLVRELTRLGHRVLFLERDVEWYGSNRDMPRPPFGTTRLYTDLSDLKIRFEENVREADAVIIGSYVQDGIEAGEWVRRINDQIVAFYDIDTPVTLAKLSAGTNDYLSRELIAKYDLYLSFTGGPTLKILEKKFGSPIARALYCSFDPEIYFPEKQAIRWDFGYMGTYSDDRQPTVNRLLVEAARQAPSQKFAVVGPQYPKTIQWPRNVERINHLSPRDHRRFYNAQRFTLNVTRRDMIAAGYSPSVRLFEAAACGTPIISDFWRGLDELFALDDEILVANGTQDTLKYLSMDDSERRELGSRARARVMMEHTAKHRAAEMESYLLELSRKEIFA
jgi:spore maturation protein CgeB